MVISYVTLTWFWQQVFFFVCVLHGSIGSFSVFLFQYFVSVVFVTGYSGFKAKRLDVHRRVLHMT